MSYLQINTNPIRSIVVLICNNKYLIPTISTALSARINISELHSRVKIFVFDKELDESSSIIETLKLRGIEMQWIEIEEFGEIAAFHLDRYLPPVTLARFWLNKMLDENIDKFLYLDGDIMVDGSLESLFQRNPAEGKLLVCRDNVQIFAGEKAPSAERDRAYLAGIGITESDYFNAGVIYCNRKDWNEIAQVAMDFLKSNSELCRSSDQSALNYAAKSKTEFLPQRLNYQSEHMMLFDPRSKFKDKTFIYHFTSGPKPWIDAGWPWDKYFNKYYDEACKLMDEFRLDRGLGPSAQSNAGKAHRARFRFRNKFIYPWRAARRRKWIKGELGCEPHQGVAAAMVL